jgi:hypothetical protein
MTLRFALIQLSDRAAQVGSLAIVNEESPRILGRSRLRWLRTLQRLHKERKPAQLLMHIREDTKNRKEHAKQGY